MDREQIPTLTSTISTPRSRSLHSQVRPHSSFQTLCSPLLDRPSHSDCLSPRQGTASQRSIAALCLDVPTSYHRRVSYPGVSSLRAWHAHTGGLESSPREAPLFVVPAVPAAFSAVCALAPRARSLSGAQGIADVYVRDRSFSMESTPSCIGSSAWFLSCAFWMCLQIAGVLLGQCCDGSVRFFWHVAPHASHKFVFDVLLSSSGEVSSF